MDHPATQAWKRQLLANAGIAVPESVTLAPVDFEHNTLAQGLSDAGFDDTKPALFTWLVVVPYLTADAIWSTLSFIANLPASAQVVFDYGDPPESLTPETRAAYEERAARVAALGEAWLTSFHPEHLHSRLRSIGFSELEDIGPRQIVARYFPHRAIGAADTGGHVIRAASRRNDDAMA